MPWKCSGQALSSPVASRWAETGRHRPRSQGVVRLQRVAIGTYRDVQGRQKSARARVIDFDNAPGANRFLAVRELKLAGIRTPNYNRRADLVCFVNGLRR